MNKNGTLFNSKKKPLPRLRPELDIIPVKRDGETYLYFHDALGYTTPDFAIERQIGPLLSMLDGQKSIEQLRPYLGEGVTPDQVLQYIQFLDKHRLLLTPHFQQHANRVEQEYESSDTHKSSSAGTSYPADPGELRTFLEEAFAKHEQTGTKNKNVKALYAPHIDPRVGLDSYVKAFSSLKELQPKRVIFLATSHYSGMYPDLYENKPFIVSHKDFEMPLDTIEADTEAIYELLAQPDELGVTDKDRAHRIEHSIELHLLFLSFLWDHNFSIVPILIRSFDQLLLMEDGHLGTQVENFSNYLRSKYGEDEETLFLISGDLSHIGKKFGDDKPAAEMFKAVRSFDKMFIKYARQGDTRALLNLMKDDLDPYRVCGFAPLYTFLSSSPAIKGEQLSYDLWDETERESAVSFGSILYRT